MLNISDIISEQLSVKRKLDGTQNYYVNSLIFIFIFYSVVLFLRRNKFIRTVIFNFNLELFMMYKKIIFFIFTVT